MRHIIFALTVFLITSLWSCGGDDAVRKFNCEESTLTIGVVEITSASSCSVADGMVEVVATGGTEPYQFFVNDEIRVGPLFEDLPSGVYTIRVRDSKKCERVVSNVSVQAQGFLFDTEISGDTECIGGNGSIAIQVNEGTPPYQFKIGVGSFTASNQFSGLNSGTYEVTIKDGNNCSVFLNLTVPKGFTGTSFQDDILPLIKTYCAKSGCHNGVDRTDLRIYTNAKKYASDIKKLTRSREMPFEGSLTQDQIDLFSCWVDDGALNN